MGKLKDAFYYPKRKKREAIKFWGKAGGSTYDKGHALMRKPGVWNKIKGWLYKYPGALGAYGAESAAHLAPNNLATAGLDIVSMGKGTLATKGVVKGIQLLRGAKAAQKSGSALAKTLRVGAKAAKDWSQPY